MAPFKLLIFTAIGTLFGCLTAIVSRYLVVGTAEAARVALTVDVIAAAVVLAAILIAWRRDHDPLPEDEDDGAFKARFEARVHRSIVVLAVGIMLFGAVFGAFYAQAGAGYLLAGMLVGVATTLYGLSAKLDYYYRPSLLMIIYLVESGVIAWVTSR